MARAKQLSDRARHPKFVWDDTMRTAIYLLTAEFGLSNQPRADVFNKMFAQELEARNCAHGIRREQVTAQYQMSKQPEKAKCWYKILAPPTTPAEELLRENLRARVRQVLHAAIPSSSLQPEATAPPRTDVIEASRSKPIANSARVRHQCVPSPGYATPSYVTPPSALDRGAAVASASKVLCESSHADPGELELLLVASKRLPKESARPSTRDHINSKAPATPPSSSRKRQASCIVDLTDTDDDVEQVASLRSKRARRMDPDAAMVPLFPIISRREALPQAQALRPSMSQVLHTPSKTKAVKKVGTPREKFIFTRPDGSRINTSKSRQAGTLMDLVPISTRVAEPPRPDLVFR